MRSLISASLLALLAALLISFLYKPKPLDAQLLHLQLERTLPEYSEALADERAELQALFLLYADDPVLTAKARLALLRYPEAARLILLMFGDSHDFQTILRKYGEDVILPVHYFLTHEVFTLELMRGMSESARSALDAIRGLWSDSKPAQAGSGEALSSEDRGWYAVQFIKAEGYDFLGQFVLDSKGDVHWIQTERVLEGINGFFASGLKGLETKLRRDETIAAGDVGWAALDVAIGVGALKVLRMGKAGAAGGRSLTFSQRSAALGSGLWRTSAIGTRVLKYGAPAVLAYIAVRHPSVINSLFGSVAERLGLPTGLVQVAGWFLVLLPIMLLLRFAIGPLAWVMVAIAGLLRWGQGLLRGRPAVL